VRLASELSGWQLNIMTTEEREQKSERTVPLQVATSERLV